MNHRIQLHLPRFNTSTSVVGVLKACGFKLCACQRAGLRSSWGSWSTVAGRRRSPSSWTPCSSAASPSMRTTTRTSERLLLLLSCSPHACFWFFKIIISQDNITLNFISMEALCFQVVHPPQSCEGNILTTPWGNFFRFGVIGPRCQGPLSMWLHYCSAKNAWLLCKN